MTLSINLASYDKLSFFTMKEEEETRDYENYDDEEEEDYQGPDVGETTSEEADTVENRDRDAYEEDPNYNEEEVKYEEPYEESNGEEPETER